MQEKLENNLVLFSEIGQIHQYVLSEEKVPLENLIFN